MYGKDGDTKNRYRQEKIQIGSIGSSFLAWISSDLLLATFGLEFLSTFIYALHNKQSVPSPNSWVTTIRSVVIYAKKRTLRSDSLNRLTSDI